jgi:rhodanese-related sulfurtransferase
MRRLFLADLAWAALILVLAASFGVLEHWNLVRISFRGELKTALEKLRAEQRQVKFQGVMTISLPQAYEIFQKGEALFLDARPGEEYAELHIPGALNLTPEGLEKGEGRAVETLPQDRQIVVYCGQIDCDAALKVAEKLQSLGFTRVSAFLEGFSAWDQAGYPADTSK